ncbi:MAG TPA: tetratricopeptide repeat protein [Methanospirillum sp.]|uniref:tetratricopeptide repeat protein n=1 Tax=Methanospirillum sp. TaxID=45200 RepID=UPI002B7B1740|nr:tetratricopeptide repeat protein [Methanospirillum sp.]HOJ96984.1 tetratricopeptide repeat protein [Methanospirillum sp.]HOL40204.1 tetratricopeptide repeat protein [Methanospirillum sp.]
MSLKVVCLFFILAGLLVPAGVLAADDGWSHGSLFSAPNWLLEQFDDESREMSKMDYFGTKLVEPTPTQPTAMDLVKEGWAYLEGGNYKDALKSFEKALAINGSSPEAWYGRGLALENQKRYLSAIDAYTKALSYSKKPASSWGANAGKGRSYLALNQFENAKEALTLAISQYEQSGENMPDERASMYRDLAQALEMLGENDAAQEALEKAG